MNMEVEMRVDLPSVRSPCSSCELQPPLQPAVDLASLSMSCADRRA